MHKLHLEFCRVAAAAAEAIGGNYLFIMGNGPGHCRSPVFAFSECEINGCLAILSNERMNNLVSGRVLHFRMSHLSHSRQRKTTPSHPFALTWVRRMRPHFYLFVLPTFAIYYILYFAWANVDSCTAYSILAHTQIEFIALIALHCRVPCTCTSPRIFIRAIMFCTKTNAPYARTLAHNGR